MTGEILLTIALLVAQPEAGLDPRAEAERELGVAVMMYRERSDSPVLAERLIETARRAFEEGRYADAVEYSQRARSSLTRQSAEPGRSQTAPSAPTIGILLEAITRLQAAENQGIDPGLLAPIHELVETAEISLYRNDVTRADQLSRRAIELLAGLGPPTAPSTPRSEPRRINLNSATRSELLDLPGMSEKMVENILWFRKYIGTFLAVEELRFVPGFSREYVELSGPRLTVRQP